MRLVQNMAYVIHRICNVFSWVATFALFSMMALTFLDVLCRYIFNTSIIGTKDITEQLMVTVVFCTLGQVTLDRTHICADLLNPILSQKKLSILGAINFMIAGIPVFFMALQTSKEASRAAMNLKLTTQTIKLPIAPFYILAAIGLILLFFEIVFDIVRYVMEARAEGINRD